MTQLKTVHCELETEETWQRETPYIPGSRSRSRRSTPSVSGRCGWFCASANWHNARLTRSRMRHLLRLLANHLNNPQAIKQWIEEHNT